MPADLDRRGAHAAGTSVHEQALAHRQLALGEQRVVRGREHLGAAAGLGPPEVVGHRHQLPLVDHGELGLAATPDDRQHALGSGGKTFGQTNVTSLRDTLLHPPPLWREGRAPAELAALVRDPVHAGRGVPHGDGAPVLLVPGYLAGDGSMAVMARWLRRIGY